MRSRESEIAKATAPISRPTTVTLNATRRFVAERGGVAVGQAGERRRQRDQGPHQTQRRAGAHEHAGPPETALGVEVEVGERLVDLVVAAGLRTGRR